MLNDSNSSKAARRVGLSLVGLAIGASATLLISTTPVAAQNRYFPIPPANSAQLPPGISVKKTPIGDVYVDAKGRTLYGMDFDTLVLDSLDPAKFCSGACAEKWVPVAPPPGTPPTPEPNLGPFGAAFGSGTPQNPVAKRVLANQARAAQVGLGFAGGPSPAGPDWTVTEGANGPQLMYKRTNLVFVRKDDAPGSTKWDGDDKMRWNVLRYVPPEPKIVAPPNVATLFVNGGYAFADKSDRVLFTQAQPGKCGAVCAKPVPFTAGFISHGVGDWAITRDGDVAQWTYRGKPVFLSQGAPKSADVPAGATILRP